MFKFKFDRKSFPSVTLYILLKGIQMTFSSGFALKFKFKFDRQNFPNVTLCIVLMYLKEAILLVPSYATHFLPTCANIRFNPLGRGQVFRSRNLVFRVAA